MLDADGRPIELGRGAMGVTYKAPDVDLRCPVTLKFSPFLRKPGLFHNYLQFCLYIPCIALALAAGCAFVRR
jgi:hypothetical protein